MPRGGGGELVFVGTSLCAQLEGDEKRESSVVTLVTG